MELNLNQENKKYQNSLIFLVALASLEFPPRHRPILFSFSQRGLESNTAIMMVGVMMDDFIILEKVN